MEAKREDITWRLGDEEKAANTAASLIFHSLCDGSVWWTGVPPLAKDV